MEIDIGVERKRMKPSTEEKEEDMQGAIVKTTEETDTNIAGSEEMEFNINRILVKIEHFTQMVSEMLECGKAMLKELSEEFEEQMISIHQGQVEKWQEEIRLLRMLDASNVETDALLHNARNLIHGVHIDS